MIQKTLLKRLLPVIKSGGRIIAELLLIIVGLILLLKNLRQDWTLAGLIPSIFVLGLGIHLVVKRLLVQRS